MAIRIATSGDTLLAHNISIGDMIYDTEEISGIYQRYDLGLNPANGLPYSGASINTPDRMLASLGTGTTIHLSGGTYNSIRLYLGKLSGITITNTGGQCHLLDTDNDSNNYPSFQLLGGNDIKVSGKYVSGYTGDPNYLGHDGGYDFSQGTYGLFIDRNGLPGDQAITVEGDDKGMIYATGDSRYFYYIAPTHYEMEYIEAGWGGFTIFDIKHTAGFQERYDDFKIHDCYLHDGGSEGCYNGNNSISANANVLTNFWWYNNRIIRMGTEGMQWGMLGKGSKIFNNVVVMSALQWKNLEFAFGDNTQNFQDGMMQLDVFDCDVEVYNNYFLGGGGTIIRMNGTLTGYTDNGDPVSGGTLTLYNNLFYGTRSGTFLYIGQNTPVVTYHIDLVIRDNYFGDLDNLYAEVGGSGTDAYAITNNNDDNTIIMSGNTYDTSMTFFSDVSTNTGITNTGNTQAIVNRPVFTDWGLPSNHDYRNMEEHANVYDWFHPNSGLTIEYVVGDYVYHNRKIYEALTTNNSDPPPSANWKLKIFSGETAPFDPFSDISWDVAFDPATALDLATVSGWTNQGSDPDDAEVFGSAALPLYVANSGDPYVHFVRDVPRQLTYNYNVALNQAFDIWVRFNVDDFDSTQVLFSYGGANMLRFLTNGSLQWGSDVTNVYFNAGAEYVIRLTRATSSTEGTITVNGGTPTGFTISTGSNTNGVFGGNDAGGTPSSHKQFELFAYKGGILPTSGSTNMWEWFGYPVSGITAPSTIESGDTITGSYDWVVSGNESSIPPIAENVELNVPTTLSSGETITITYDYNSPSGTIEGESVYSFYNASNTRGDNLTLRQMGTGNTYLLGDSDDLLYMLGSITPVDVNGVSGFTTQYTDYSDSVVTGDFNPLSIDWYLAATPNSIDQQTDGAVVSGWTNQGSSVNDLVGFNTPIYNSGTTSVRCADGDVDNFTWGGFPGGSSGDQFEVCTVVKLESFVSFGQVDSITSSIYMQTRAGTISTAIGSDFRVGLGTQVLTGGTGTTFVNYYPIGEWVYIDWVWRGSGGQDVYFNNEISGHTVASSGTIGTGVGRLNSGINQNNPHDTSLKYWFITERGTLLTDQERSDMRQWAINNNLFDTTI